MRKFVVRWLTRFLIAVGVVIPVVRLNPGEAQLLKQELSAIKPFNRTIRLHGTNDPLWGYFHPAWRESYQAQMRELRFFAGDPDNKLEREFRIHGEDSGRVLFWAAIYARFPSQVKVIHDRENPGLVYGILDFRPLYRSNKSAGASRAAARIEKQALHKLGIAILQTGTNGPTDLAAHDQAALKQLIVANGGAFRERWELVTSLRSQTGQSDSFQLALERSQQFLPHIEEVFAKHGLPKGLARIPFVESSFNNSARSRVGAVGIWQFIPRTSREMIHRRDRTQWSDPVRQTTAAAKLLKRYRSVLPDWGTTVTSYNSGIGRISRLLREGRGKAVGDLLRNPSDNGLGFAGENYHAEVLAANLVESYKTQLFSPGTLPKSLAMLRKQTFADPVNACWMPISTATPRRKLFADIAAAEFSDSSRDVGEWIRQALSDVSGRLIASVWGEGRENVRAE